MLYFSELFKFVTFDHIASKQISRYVCMIYVNCELFNQGALFRTLNENSKSVPPQRVMRMIFIGCYLTR